MQRSIYVWGLTLGMLSILGCDDQQTQFPGPSVRPDTGVVPGNGGQTSEGGAPLDAGGSQRTAPDAEGRPAADGSLAAPEAGAPDSPDGGQSLSGAQPATDASQDSASEAPQEGGMADMDAGDPPQEGGMADMDAGMSDPGRCDGSGLGPGDYTRELEHGGRTRTFNIHVPSGHDATTPVPLVLNFHGYTSNASQQASLSQMPSKADEEGFIVVHPEGVDSSWNAGSCCGTAASEGVDDVGFVRKIVDHMAGAACIDKSRVYATGMSNGGFLSHRLACEASDVIAAVAPVAGAMGIAQCNPGRSMPVMSFHGTSDSLVPFSSAESAFQGWVDRNGCTDTAEVTLEMGDATCNTHDECDGGVVTTLCEIEGGGHDWPSSGGGGFFGGGGGSISATDQMWNFLQQWRLP